MLQIYNNGAFELKKNIVLLKYKFLCSLPWNYLIVDSPDSGSSSIMIRKCIYINTLSKTYFKNYFCVFMQILVLSIKMEKHLNPYKK